MNHLDHARRIEETPVRGAEEVTGEEDEPRPDTLPRGCERFARSLGERIERIRIGPPPADEEARQSVVDGRLDLGEDANESVGSQKLASASFSSEYTSKTVMS
jgi:hypothetical protein